MCFPVSVSMLLTVNTGLVAVFPPCPFEPGRAPFTLCRLFVPAVPCSTCFQTGREHAAMTCFSRVCVMCLFCVRCWLPCLNFQQRPPGTGSRSARSCQQHLRRACRLGGRRRRRRRWGGDSIYRRLEWPRVYVGRSLSGGRQRGRRE